MEFTSFKWLNESEVIAKGDEIAIYAPAKTDYFNNPIPEDGTLMKPQGNAQLMVSFAVFNGLGRPTFGWLTDRLASKKAMLLSYSLILLSATLLIAAGQNNKLIYIISFSVFWFNLGGWLAIAPASTLRLYGIKNYSQNYGLVFTAYGIGAIIGVSTSGLLLDFHKNYFFVFYYIIALCIFGVLLTTNLISSEN